MRLSDAEARVGVCLSLLCQFCNMNKHIIFIQRYDDYKKCKRLEIKNLFKFVIAIFRFLRRRFSADSNRPKHLN